MAFDDLGDSLRLRPLLEALDRQGVDFVLVGGLAGLVHGSAYPTYDCDIAYSREPSNLKRLAAALEEIGVTLRGAPSDLPFRPDAQTLAKGANFTFETKFGSFDILGEVAGIKSYESLRSKSKVERVEGLEVRIAALEDLIAMKRAANRVKDRLMVLEYVELADLRRREQEAGGN